MERNPRVEEMITRMKITEEEALALIEFEKAVPKPAKAKTTSPEPSQAAPAKRSSGNAKADFMGALLGLVEGNAAMLDPQQLKATSVTFKDGDGNYYTLALTAHKACPAGYKG